MTAFRRSPAPPGTSPAGSRQTLPRPGLLSRLSPLKHSGGSLSVWALVPRSLSASAALCPGYNTAGLLQFHPAATFPERLETARKPVVALSPGEVRGRVVRCGQVCEPAPTTVGKQPKHSRGCPAEFPRNAGSPGPTLWPHPLPSKRFHVLLTLSSKSFSTFPHGTCPLSVSCRYLALDGAYHPPSGCTPKQPYSQDVR